MSPKDRARIQQLLMKELVTACLGDRAKAIRLIEYEQKLNPALKTLEATESALDRLCYDRGKAKREATYDPKLFRGSNQNSRAFHEGSLSKEQAPPNVSAGMVISVILACAVVFGVFSIASGPSSPIGQPLIQAYSPSKASSSPVHLPANRGELSINSHPSDTPYAASHSDGIFKCITNGKTAYSDKPCGNASTANPLTLPPDTAGFLSPIREPIENLVARRISSARENEKGIQIQKVATAEQTVKMECAALSKHIKWIEDMARQPQGAQVQDRLKDEKARARGRQYELRC